MDRTQSDLLKAVIESSTSDRLKRILKDICVRSGDAYKLACSLLLLREDVSREEEADGEIKEDATTRYEMCEQCRKEYDVLANGEKACVWHEGELERDDEHDCWTDMDDYMLEEGSDAYWIKEQPEGFLWNCCDAKGDTDPQKSGCQTSRHEPLRNKKSRN
ncbi:hypothetical protein M011DRAFT_410377 [Sporormia fimetaria CBS 119925]|uniref:C2H2-type domain-containing protein n=1 Tax=Sporormia fimetaria CBS 119925 TaxID=1340428 RepID=A0A6A6UZG2_9PLEO|nr:hypothetical protein M011DRAFT_410377 [Sporormia fimetaria CBS 119925]